MPNKVERTGITGTFSISYPTGRWHNQAVHGLRVFIDAKQAYERFSPRVVAITDAMRYMWLQNAGTLYPWRRTLSDLRYYVRGVGVRSRYDYRNAKVLLREMDPGDTSPDGTRWVYFSSRGSDAVSGFVTEADAAVLYEAKNHRMLKVMEGRIAHATVESAGAIYSLPVLQRTIDVKTLT